MDTEHKDLEVFYEPPLKMTLECGAEQRLFARNMVSWMSASPGLTRIRAFDGQGDHAVAFFVKHSIEEVDAMFEKAFQA